VCYSLDFITNFQEKKGRDFFFLKILNIGKKIKGL